MERPRSWISLAEAMSRIEEYEKIDPQIAERIRKMWDAESRLRRRKQKTNFILLLLDHLRERLVRRRENSKHKALVSDIEAHNEVEAARGGWR